MASLFLSYDRDDFAAARVVAEALEREGHEVWWDRQLKGGAEFSKQIEEALDGAEAVVVLWSRHAVDSAWVRDEAGEGRDKGRLVPATIDGTLPPLGFRQFQTVDLSGPPLRRGSKRLASLVDAVTERVASGSHGSTGASLPTQPPRGVSRRAVVGGGVAATGALAAGGGFLLLRAESKLPSPEVQALMDQGMDNWLQGDAEGNNQAIGLYRRATELAPDHADAWGLLAGAYADRAHWHASAAERRQLRARAQEAARRAFDLDPSNAHARSALAYNRPFRGSWLHMEREFRAAIEDAPGTYLIVYSLALLLAHVGRVGESADHFAQLDRRTPGANQIFFHSAALWSSGRVAEAERMIDDAASIFATHPRIWIMRYNMALVGGRAAAALALAEDSQTRPNRVAETWLGRRAEVARALASGASEQIASVAAALVRDARHSANDAVRSVQDLAILNRVDEAFAVADAYFFSRDFAVPDVPPAPGRSAEINFESRYTNFLFLPTTAAMRSDRRFQRLVEEIGLARYWQAVGVQPDYRRG